MFVSTPELLTVTHLNQIQGLSGTLASLNKLLKKNPGTVDLRRVFQCFNGILGSSKPRFTLTSKWNVLDTLLKYYLGIDNEILIKDKIKPDRESVWISNFSDSIPECGWESANLIVYTDHVLTLCNMGINELRSGTLRTLNDLLQTNTQVNLAEIILCFYEILGTQQPLQTVTCKWDVLEKITSHYFALPVKKFMQQISVVGVTRQSVPAFLELCHLTKGANDGGRILDSFIKHFSWTAFSSIGNTIQSLDCNSQNLRALFDIIYLQEGEINNAVIKEIINCLQKLRTYPQYSIVNESSLIKYCVKMGEIKTLKEEIKTFILEQCLSIGCLEKFMNTFEPVDIEPYFAQFSDENLFLFIEYFSKNRYDENDLGFANYTRLKSKPASSLKEPLCIPLGKINAIIPYFLNKTFKDQSVFLRFFKDDLPIDEPLKYTLVSMFRNVLIECYFPHYRAELVKVSLSLTQSLDENRAWSVFVIHLLLSNAQLQNAFYQWPLAHIIKNHEHIKQQLLDQPLLNKENLPQVLAMDAQGLDSEEKLAVEALRANLMKLPDFEQMRIKPLRKKYTDWMSYYISESELYPIAEKLEQLDGSTQRALIGGLHLLKYFHYLGPEHVGIIQLILNLIANGELTPLISNKKKVEVLMLVALANNVSSEDEIRLLHQELLIEDLDEKVDSQFVNCPTYAEYRPLETNRLTLSIMNPNVHKTKSVRLTEAAFNSDFGL